MAEANRHTAQAHPGRALPLTLGLVGVVLLALGALIVLRGQRPIAPVAAISVDDAVLHDTILTGTNREGLALVYDHDAPGAFAIELENTSKLPVTITGLETESDRLHLLSAYGAFVLPAGAELGGDLEGGEPLDSLTIGPGSSRILVVRGVFANCRYYNERNIDLRDQIDVHYRLLGVSGTQTIAFDRDLLVKSPMIVHCPERTVNREDDIRKDVLDE